MRSLEHVFTNLILQLPRDDLRDLNYGMSAMEPFRSDIDKISDLFISSYCKDDYDDLIDMLQKISGQYERAYGNNKMGTKFIDTKMEDLYKRLETQY